MRRWLRNDEGATSIEYALIASVVSIGILAALVLTRTNLVTLLGQVSSAFTTR